MNKYTKAHIFVAMFMGMMVLPWLLFIPLKDYVDTENYENRVYQEKPALRVHGIKTYPGLYDAYLNDHLAFKNPLAAFVKLADIRVFGEVSSDAVLIGRDDRMFHKLKNENEDSPTDCQGTNRYPEEKLECFARFLEQVDHHFASRDIKLISYIVPNKEQVHSEYIPSSIKVVNEEPKADRLFEYLRDHMDMDVYYPSEEFKRVKDDWCQIHRKYDTHWDDMGAFLVFQMVIRDIDNEKFGPEPYTEYPIENKGSFSGDLAVILNLQNYYDDDPSLKVGGYRDDITISMDYKNERGTVIHYPSDVWDDTRKTSIYRDSFGVHMAEYSAKDYPDVTLLDYRAEDYGAAVMDRKPDMVVIEVVERYTNCMFGLLDQLAGIQRDQSKECVSCQKKEDFNDEIQNNEI